MDQEPKLLSFEFAGLLGIVLLVFSNIAVFFNFYNHLCDLGIPGDLRGVLIGIFSLSAVPLFLFAGPFVNHRNAPALMLLGIGILAVSGVSYLFVGSFWPMLALRLFNGVGMFCMSASCLALLVWVVPERKSGQGFALYSSAIVLPYALVPLVIDALSPWIANRAYAYAVMALLLIPAAGVVLLVMHRRRSGGQSEPKPRLPSIAELKANISRGPVALCLVIQGLYFMNFSGLFFLLKGFAQKVGLENVGHFFAAQMLVILLIRTVGGRVFDKLSKVMLLSVSFLITASGYLALVFVDSASAMMPFALAFGVGAGVGYPALNSLMFLYSPPSLRAANANLMMLALYLGYFFGPVLGGSMVVHTGYRGFLLAWMAMNLAAFLICALFMRNPDQADGPLGEASRKP